MYCPKCGNERVSEETSYCSKCGMLLDHIEDVMENGGEPLDGFDTEGQGSFLNRRNIRISALLWFVVLAVFIFPFAAIMRGPKEMILTLGIMGPVGAAVILIISMFFPETKKAAKTKRKISGPGTERKELPPEKTVFAEDFVAPSASGRDSDFAGITPSSVTEETTCHLDKKIDE